MSTADAEVGAPSHVSQAAFDSWLRNLSDTTPLSVAALAECDAPLMWAANSADGSFVQLAKELGEAGIEQSSIAELLERWLSTSNERTPASGYALECLAWAHALPELAKWLATAPWSQLCDELTTIARQAARSQLLEPLPYQLLAAELPLTLGYLLPDLPGVEALSNAASEAVSRSLCEFHDGEGLPKSAHLGEYRLLLASWTRCALIAAGESRRVFAADAETQYEWAVTQTLRLTRADGGQVFSPPGEYDASLFRAILRLVGDAKDIAAARALLPKPKSLPAAAKPSKLRTPAIYSEWSDLAVMRTDWKRDALQLAVGFHGGRVRSELSSRREILWSGDTTPEIEINGKKVSKIDEWEEVCWFSDADVDYLELEADLPRGWRIQRQWLLSRKDRILLHADALLGGGADEIGYTLRLPLNEDLRFRPGEETREAHVSGRRPLAAVMPLALPEWRVEASHGEFQNTEAGLTYRFHEKQAKALYAPLVWDLHPTRHVKELTWRRLTVAEQLAIQPRDVAVGYRVQVGKTQWLIYRSLAEVGNRTVLGQNTTSEFICGRFSRRGQVTPLIDIE